MPTSLPALRDTTAMCWLPECGGSPGGSPLPSSVLRLSLLSAEIFDIITTVGEDKFEILHPEA